jgi:hypothetical protein
MPAARGGLDGVSRFGIAARDEIRERRGGSPGEIEEELSQGRRAKREQR